MNTQNDQPQIFFKAVMTGLFIGVIDTVICLAYNIGYRSETGYIPSTIVNVSSIIFAVCLVGALVGILYYFILRILRNAGMVFAVLILALTAWLAVKTFTSVRFDDPKLDNGWHGLMGGIVLILGLSCACLPFLYKSRKFQDAVIGNMVI